jgi:hypothetical protein
MLWPRLLHFGSRLIVSVLATIVVVLVSVRVYVEYEIHCATSILAKASRVQIGDPEAAILPLVKQYSGFKWEPDSLGPRENWTDKDEYDYKKELASDYRYDLEVSPFGLIPSDLSWGQHRITQAIRAAINHTPVHLRAVLGMRDWGTGVGFTIRGARVQSVSAIVLVEGRPRWLGHEWKLVNAMPERRMRAKTFIVESGFLEMANNGGELTQNIFTSRASDEEVQVSRKFNTACFTSLRGCGGFCDFVPHTIEYLVQHPDTAGNFIPPKCP